MKIVLFLLIYTLIYPFSLAHATEKITVWGDAIPQTDYIEGQSPFLNKWSEGLLQNSPLDISEQSTQNTGFYFRGSSFNIITIDDIPIYDSSSIDYRVLLDSWSHFEVENYEIEAYPIRYGSLGSASLVKLKSKKQPSYFKMAYETFDTKKVSLQKKIKTENGEHSVQISTRASRGYAVVDQVVAAPKSSEAQGLKLSSEFNVFEKSKLTLYTNLEKEKSELAESAFVDSVTLNLETHKMFFSAKLQSDKSNSSHFSVLKSKRHYTDKNVTDTTYDSSQFQFYLQKEKISFWSRFDSASVSGYWASFPMDMPPSQLTEAQLTYSDYLSFLNSQGSKNWSLETGLGINSIKNLFYALKLNFQKDISESSYLNAWIVKNNQSPSLFQWRDPQYGNKNLKMQESLHAEIRWDFFTKNSNMYVSLFKSQYSNLIDFQNNQYVNEDCAVSQGFEGSVLKKQEIISNQVILAYSEYKNCKTNDWIKGRAPMKFTYNLLYDLTDESQWTLQALHTSARKASSQDIPAYEVFNLFNSYQFNSDFRMTFSIKNLTDKDYRVVKGYLPEPRSFGAQGELFW